MTHVWILDGDQRAALAIARSLVREDVEVLVGTPSAANLASRADRVRGSFSYPDPLRDALGFDDWRRAISPDVRLIPVTDATTMLCQERHSPGGYEAVTDKANLMSLARQAGVPCPAGSIAGSRDELNGCLASHGQPVVLKPARSKFLHDGRVVATSVRLAPDTSAAAALMAEADWFPTIPVIVQEFIPGHGAGVFCLYDRDHAIAWFAHRRIREKPPSGGVSVLCESVPVDPLLKDYAERLLRAAEYRGVAMVEFRITPDGRPYLMEVNARFWGSLQLAIDCGVDFPWLYYRMLMGEKVEPVSGYQVGRRLRWFLGDLDHLLIRLRDPAEMLADKIAAVGRFLGTGFDFRCRQEVFRWSDPRPGWFELQQWIANVAGRAQ